MIRRIREVYNELMQLYHVPYTTEMNVDFYKMAVEVVKVEELTKEIKRLRISIYDVNENIKELDDTMDQY